MDIGQKMMFAFFGKEPNESIIKAIHEKHISGLTLFRHFNIDHPAQIRELTSQLQVQAKKAGAPLLLIAADQEGGQLNGLGEEPTPFPGNMALGATQDADLAYKVGEALGVELAAMGVNINYAPVADVSTKPHNPSVGIRSFGDNPENVAKLTAAFVRGSQSAGVASTVKHFPGSGEAAVDPHLEIPVIDHSKDRFESVELVPFVSAINEGVKLIMTGHIAVPAFTGDESLPATLSQQVLGELVRKQLGFGGVVISDAIEMAAIAQGRFQLVDIIAATLAGVDLLLLNADEGAQERTYLGFAHSVSRGVIPMDLLGQSLQRIEKLKEWLAQFTQPELDMVGCQTHRDLAYQVSKQALTLVRNEKNLIPLPVKGDQKIIVIVPKPKDLTPADTSSLIKIELAEEIRKYQPGVEQIDIPHHPDQQEIAVVIEKLKECDLVIAGSINAHMNVEQAALMNEVLRLEKPVVSAALRTPYDLLVYPQAKTYVCTYGILPPSIKAFAAALFGEEPFEGRLPVSIPDLYKAGYQLEN
ncbi:glycoside hydrolase family 3 N-terminal domain-containing protein [Chloroflexota bacterium]